MSLEFFLRWLFCDLFQEGDDDYEVEEGGEEEEEEDAVGEEDGKYLLWILIKEFYCCDQRKGLGVHVLEGLLFYYIMIINTQMF